MTLETLVNHISSIKDDIKLAIKDKGITMAKTVPFEKYADYIRQIKEAEVGQTQIREWQPDPNWYDIDTILLNDIAVPELIVKDGIAEGFSRTSYIGLPQDLPMATANSWEMNAKFVFKRVNWQQVIYSEKNIGYLSNIGITADAKMLLELSNTHTDWTMGHGNEPRVTGETVLEEGKTYFVKATFAYTDSESVYRVKLSETGAFAGEETTECEFVITRQDGYTYAPRLLDHTWSIGSSMYVDYEYPFVGKLDLTKCNIIINGAEFWNGADGDYDVHNSTLIGEGFQINPSYITSNMPLSTAHTWELVVKVDAQNGVLFHERVNWGSYLAIADMKLVLKLSNSHDRWNGSYNIGVLNGTTVLEEGKSYYIRVYYEGTKYQLFLSETGAFAGEELLEAELESSVKCANYTWNVCDKTDDDTMKLAGFVGKLYLADTYFAVNGSRHYWEGREIVDVSYLDDKKKFGKVILLLGNWEKPDARAWENITTTIHSMRGAGDGNILNAFKTSDGRFYTRREDGDTSINHIFDSYFDKKSSSTDVTTRYVIFYENRRRAYTDLPTGGHNRFDKCFSFIARDLNVFGKNGSNKAYSPYFKSIKFLGDAFPGTESNNDWDGNGNFLEDYNDVENYYCELSHRWLDEGASHARKMNYYIWKTYRAGDKKSGLQYNCFDDNNFMPRPRVIDITNCDFEHCHYNIFSNLEANGIVFKGVIDLSHNEINANKTYTIFNDYNGYWFKGTCHVFIKLPDNANVNIRVMHLSHESLKYLLDNAPELTEQKTITISTQTHSRMLMLHHNHLAVYKGKEYSDGIQLLKAKGWTVALGN